MKPLVKADHNLGCGYTLASCDTSDSSETSLTQWNLWTSELGFSCDSSDTLAVIFEVIQMSFYRKVLLLKKGNYNTLFCSLKMVWSHSTENETFYQCRINLHINSTTTKWRPTNQPLSPTHLHSAHPSCLCQIKKGSLFSPVCIHSTWAHISSVGPLRSGIPDLVRIRT